MLHTYPLDIRNGLSPNTMILLAITALGAWFGIVCLGAFTNLSGAPLIICTNFFNVVLLVVGCMIVVKKMSIRNLSFCSSDAVEFFDEQVISYHKGPFFYKECDLGERRLVPVAQFPVSLTRVVAISLSDVTFATCRMDCVVEPNPLHLQRFGDLTMVCDPEYFVGEALIALMTEDKIGWLPLDCAIICGQEYEWQYAKERLTRDMHEYGLIVSDIHCYVGRQKIRSFK